MQENNMIDRFVTANNENANEFDEICVMTVKSHPILIIFSHRINSFKSKKGRKKTKDKKRENLTIEV